MFCSLRFVVRQYSDCEMQMTEFRCDTLCIVLRIKSQSKCWTRIFVPTESVRSRNPNQWRQRRQTEWRKKNDYWEKLIRPLRKSAFFFCFIHSKIFRSTLQYITNSFITETVNDRTDRKQKLTRMIHFVLHTFANRHRTDSWYQLCAHK